MDQMQWAQAQEELQQMLYEALDRVYEKLGLEDAQLLGYAAGITYKPPGDKNGKTYQRQQ